MQGLFNCNYYIIVLFLIYVVRFTFHLFSLDKNSEFYKMWLDFLWIKEFLCISQVTCIQIVIKMMGWWVELKAIIEIYTLENNWYGEYHMKAKIELSIATVCTLILYHTRCYIFSPRHQYRENITNYVNVGSLDEKLEML